MAVSNVLFERKTWTMKMKSKSLQQAAEMRFWRSTAAITRTGKL